LLFSNKNIPIRLKSQLVEGAEVELLSGGGRGYLIERKGGWWTVALKNENENDINNANNILRVRSNALKLISEGIITPDIKGATSIATSSTINDNNNSIIEPLTLPTIDPPSIFKSVNKWIIFSDLHVKSSSIEICEEVLKKVHDEALERNAGIMFLGDFWHVRGVLNVELLNRVLKSLQLWSQPVIMIPGNHDQVTLGGIVHALEPLKYAFDHERILMINEPSICLNALWVPYRRDHHLMKSILKAGNDNDDIDIIFCHADVKGAFMNDGIRSREGISITEFPENMPIYSGHFHKPHTMSKGSSSLRYVGSPYQTSLSEAGQKKYLYCLSCTPDSAKPNQYKWKETERWTIDVGRKYFKALALKDPILQEARPGDRVVVPVRIGEDAEAEKKLSVLRDKGVEVEIRRESNSKVIESAMNKNDSSSDSSINSTTVNVVSDNVFSDPIALFTDFMNSGSTFNISTSKENETLPSSSKVDESDSAKKLLHDQVLIEGRNTIERLMNTEGSDSLVSTGLIRNLRLDAISLHNFGPYGGEKIDYPLSKRGLVLISGKSSDGTGADSNGSGKTTLAMSVLWALTGSMDTRLVGDGKAVDVAYDTGEGAAKRVAEVNLIGEINNKPFNIIRRRGARKNDLLFTLAGKDMTTQSVKDTQALIDEILGTGDGLLQRCCFFGQHSHTLQSLLGLTDTKLKSELSALVDTRIWTLTSQDVRSRERGDKARAAELKVEIRIRGEEAQRVKATLEDSMNLVRRLEGELAVSKERAFAEAGRFKSTLEGKFGNETLESLTTLYDKIQKEAQSTQKDTVENLRKELLEYMRTRNQKLVSFDQEIASVRESIIHIRSSSNSTVSTRAGLIKKLQLVDQQRQSLVTNLKNLTQLIDVQFQSNYNNSLQQVNEMESVTRKELDASVTAYAAINFRKNTTQISITRLQESSKNITNTRLNDATCSSHNAENCPTCGQEMVIGAREKREKELQEELIIINEEQIKLNKLCENLRRQLDLILKAKANLDSLIQLEAQAIEIRSEISSIDVSQADSNGKLQLLEKSLQSKTAEKIKAEQALIALESAQTASLQAAEDKVRSLTERSREIYSKIEELRKAENEIMALETRANATVSMIDDRLKTARESLNSKSLPLFQLESVIEEASLELKNCIDRGVVLERLLECLGPRGIQHFVFISTLKQLEEIANSYLEILADGGIRLALQGEDDVDKIIKRVLVRSSDGNFKDRGLSQLSGGQWRRVSMALDLAFVEVIRRRGTLRSNILVMDEVLTHLDGAGREAVGTVLRAMVDGEKSNSNTISNNNQSLDNPIIDGDDQPTVDSDNDDYKNNMFEMSRQLLGGGAYETVIVILQDLAAVELEEAFDHIDTVVKDSDTSRVIIDGQE